MGLSDDIAKTEAEAARLKEILAAYPDARKYEGRWKKEVYCSKQANANVTNYEQRYNCGCCNDSPLEIWPYLTVNGARIYSDPPSFMVGDLDDHGTRPYSGWDSELRKAGIPEALIAEIDKTFATYRYYEENYEPEEDEP